jgi:hypothetical protein
MFNRSLPKNIIPKNISAIIVSFCDKLLAIESTMANPSNPKKSKVIIIENVLVINENL